MDVELDSLSSEQLSPLYSRQPTPLARCINAAKRKRVAGELLFQLLHRFEQEQALRRHQGKQWVAQPARCWRDEIAVSKQQFDDAVKLLRQLGFVEVAQARVRQDSPLRITHMRPTEAAFDAVGGGLYFQNSRAAESRRSGPAARSGVRKPEVRKSPRRLGERGYSKGIEIDYEKGIEECEQQRSRSDQSGSEEQSLREEFEEQQRNDRGLLDDQEFEALLKRSRAAMPGWAHGLPLTQLVSAASERMECPAPLAKGAAKKGYEDLLLRFRRRAFANWVHRRLVPLAPEYALGLSIAFWPEFRSEYMPPGDTWPVEFLPQFTVYKAELLYDAVQSRRFEIEAAPWEKERQSRSGGWAGA